MKRFISLLLMLIILLCLSGCGKPPELGAEFDACFTVTQSDNEYKGSVSLSEGGLEIAFSEPYTVAGMSFDYSDSGMSINYADHGTRANCDYIPAGAIPSALHDTLAYIDKANYLRSEDGADIYSVITPYGEAIIKAADGLPISLEDPYSGLCFNFYERRDASQGSQPGSE